MKIFILLLLASLLITGCSTTYNYKSTHITVLQTDTTHKDYGLLSVRGDTAIVVLDWNEADVSPVPFSHAEVIKTTSGLEIMRSGHGGGGPVLVGALVGGLAGGIIGSVLAPGDPRNGGGVILCAVIGAMIANFFPPSKELHGTSKEDVKLLRSISLYPDTEPDEMKYIK